MLAGYGCVKFYSQVVFRLILNNILKFFGMVGFFFCDGSSSGVWGAEKYDSKVLVWRILWFQQWVHIDYCPNH